MIGLNAGLIIAYIMWIFGDYDQRHESGKIGAIYLIAIAVQCLHFCEEYVAGF